MKTSLLPFTIIFFMVSTLQGQDTEKKAGLLFKKSEQVLGDTRVFGIAIADVDLDGDNDVFMTNFIGASKLWLNDGKGNFTESNQNFGNSEAHAVAIEDFNADGYPDIFLLNHTAPCRIFFNDGKGTFTDSHQNIGSQEEFPGMITCGDIDNDGDIDAFISYYQLPNRLWLNNGKGYFSITDTKYGGEKGHSMVLADVNGDSYLDLYLCISDQPDEIWLNNGKGNLTDSGQRLGNLTGYETVDAGDINGDKYVDFVTGNNVDGIKIWLNQNGTGKFVEAGSKLEPGYGTCKLFDADLDGDLDLFAAGSPPTKLMINNGIGIYSTGQVFNETWVARVAFGKLNSDNYLDIILGKKEGAGGNSIYFNEFMGPNQTTFPLLKGPYLGQKLPGSTPEIFAPGIVSMPETLEWSSGFSPDGKEFYFQRVIQKEDEFQVKIFETKIIDEKWTQPAEVSFTKGYNAGAPSITPDNKTLYFGWWRPDPDGDPEFSPGRAGRIWYVNRISNGWSEPQYAGPGMFTSSDKEGNVFTTDLNSRYKNGRTYLTKTKLINGQFNVFEKQILVPDFTEPAHPCISPDGSYILFDIDGGSHLFVSFRKTDGTWGEAIDLTKHGFDVMAGGATISPDGKYLFFQLNGDLWWVDIKIIEELRPKEK